MAGHSIQDRTLPNQVLQLKPRGDALFHNGCFRSYGFRFGHVIARFSYPGDFDVHSIIGPASPTNPFIVRSVFKIVWMDRFVT